MRQILSAVSQYKEYLVLTACILLSLLLIATDSNPQIRSLRSVTIVTIGFLQDMFDVIPDYFNLRDENRILRSQNLTLSEEVSLRRNAAIENGRLREMLGLKEQTRYDNIAANIVGRNFQFFRNTITLDVGENDGVRVDMPVVSHEGLVGRVVATSSGYSVARTLFHREMKTSAKVERSRVDGILGWNGATHLMLTNVAKTLDVQVGDRLVTSEYSSVFPPGLPIGIVSRTQEETGDLFQTIEVIPLADLYRTEEVFVLLYTPDPARIALEEESAR
ncbi:MAG: rod shape-determining protein MreC [Ignavibacteria bacterium]|nr:rod shape-determining protein MreC [Ignavibacteria bacterium]